MFELTDQPIDSALLRARLARAEAGACLVFEGWVRNHHQGKPVSLLEYEAFDELARLEGATLVAEAEAAHPGASILCVHRTGALPVGEVAVWIGVAAAHRHAAYLASRQVIEEIKRRLPVWKKEHHPGEAPQWVNCTLDASVNPLSPASFYERQVSLPEVGEQRQAALASADVLVVGIGGLGCPASLYLATSGIGKLMLVDSGKVEVSNLHRQVLFTVDDVGAAKVTVAAGRLRRHNPFLKVEGLPTELTRKNVIALVRGRTAVLDCTDNFATRFLLHDACRASRVPLISAAVYRFEGELNVFSPVIPGCLHCTWSGLDPGELESAETCSGGPVFAPAVGVLGVMQAAETLKLMLGLTSEADLKRTRLVNLLDGTMTMIERRVDPGCGVCGSQRSSGTLPTESIDETPLIVTAEEMARGGAYQTVAILEAGESIDPAAAVSGTVAVPVSDLTRIRELARQRPTLLVCRRGIRSVVGVRLLRAEGVASVFALAGGFAAIKVGAPR